MKEEVCTLCKGKGSFTAYLTILDDANNGNSRGALQEIMCNRCNGTGLVSISDNVFYLEYTR